MSPSFHSSGATFGAASAANTLLQNRIVGSSSLAFTTCSAVWMFFSVVGVCHKQDLRLSDTRFGLLVGPSILTGFLAAATYGAFFIPESYGSSIALAGGSGAALWGFLIFYAGCAGLTWLYNTRRSGLLHDIEHQGSQPVTADDTSPAATAVTAS